MQRGDVPVSPAALVAGDVPDVAGTEGRKTAQVLAPDLAGLDKAYAIVGRAAHIPRVGTGAVLVDLAAVAEGPSRLAADTSYEVWLAAADDPRERRLREQLERHGLTVIARDTTSRHMGAFADEGATLALRLAVVGGIVALLIAAAVLVVAVALSGRNRARDLASLRLVGLSAGVVRAAAVREHLVVSSLGLLTGTVLGMGGAQAALPHVPLFATRSEAVSLDYAPAWQPVGLTVMTCLVLLSTISFAVGRVLARGATPRRWREAP
jgi:predicted lysophospholipase L1 biosynthesis ABC-type transport system permease subunit